MRIGELETLVAVLLDKLTVLEKLLKSDSSNSSRPPSLDAGTANPHGPLITLLSSERSRSQHPLTRHSYAEQSATIARPGTGHRPNIGITRTSA